MKTHLDLARACGAFVAMHHCADATFTPAQLDAFAERIRLDESALSDLTISLLQDTSTQLRLDAAEAWAARDAMRDERDAETERCAVLADNMQHAELCTPVNVAEAIRKAAP